MHMAQKSRHGLMFCNCVGQLFAGWRRLHHQQDASEMLEHWVAVGRPQVTAGRWEARIENQILIEIRQRSTANVTLNIDLPQSAELRSSYSLILHWHTQQLGIQAFTAPPTLLMIRLSRFYRNHDAICKVTSPVILQQHVQIPVFDSDTLQCSNTQYRVISVILRAGPNPQRGTLHLKMNLCSSRC